MPNLSMLPLTGTLVGLATQTATGSSGVLQIPNASSYRFVVQTNTVSGTTPTLQVILATSFDNGTTYNEFISFANLTTTGVGRQLTWRPYLIGGDLATSAICTQLTISAYCPVWPTTVVGPAQGRSMLPPICAWVNWQSCRKFTGYSVVPLRR